MSRWGLSEERGRTWTETFKVESGQLVDKVKELIHQGNVRQISIKQGDRVIVSLPLTLGVVAAVLAPMLAAVGAVAALVTHCTIEVERYESEYAAWEETTSETPEAAE